MDTRGRRLLAAQLQEETAVSVARELGVAVATISRLARGLSKPSIELAVAFEHRRAESKRIPCAAWVTP